MKVLSLFDGMACGMIAMQLAGVDVERYDAYEIDKYAIKTAQHNFPMIKEHGDVFDADFTQYEGVDFLIGGSPCTYWSIAQTKNRETVASGMGWELFSQYVRALHEAKPKYFIYENNKSMSKDIRASIYKEFGFEAVLINSALVSAQNRQRLYWVGKREADGTYSKLDIQQPSDRGILLRDVLDGAGAKELTEREVAYMFRKEGRTEYGYIQKYTEEKSKCITANISKGVPYNVLFEQLADPVCVVERGRMYCGQPQHYEARTDGKTNTLTSVEKDNRVAEPVKVGYVGNGGQGNRVYSVNGKAVAQTAQRGGLGAKTGLYAVPYDCDVVITENSIRCQRRDQKHSTVQGSHVNFTYVKSQTLSPTHIPNVIEHKSDKKYHGCAEVLNVNPCGHGMNGAVIHCDGKCRTLTTNKGEGPKIIEPVCLRIEFDDDDKPIKDVGKDGKEITIYEVKDGKITIKGKQYPIKLKDGYYIIRKLTVSECMRLQTVPEWYEFPVSDSQAYKMLGNGWTCEVIAHILKSLKEA